MPESVESDPETPRHLAIRDGDMAGQLHTHERGRGENGMMQSRLCQARHVLKLVVRPVTGLGGSSSLKNRQVHVRPKRMIGALTFGGGSRPKSTSFG